MLTQGVLSQSSNPDLTADQQDRKIMSKRQTQKKNNNIRVKINVDLKQAAEAILKTEGVTVSEAITMFYQEVIRLKALPFDVELPSGRRLPSNYSERHVK